MAQVWKCDRCNAMTQDPTAAGDHERKFYGRLIAYNDPEFWSPGDEPLHYMEDLGE